MKLHVVGHKLEVTRPIHDYIEQKFERLARHLDSLTEVHVGVSVEKLVHRADATVRVPHQKALHAEAEGQDLYAAIDVLADKLDQQVRKIKEKITDHHRADAPKRLPAS